MSKLRFDTPFFMDTNRHFSKELLGSLSILASAFCFYLVTVVVRWAMSEKVALSSQFLAFTRFLIGFLVVGSVLLIKRKAPQPHQYRFLLGRAIFNTLSVVFFFKAIEMTTVAESNILNMTSPIFIAIISWIIFRAQRDIFAFGMTVVAFYGIFLVLAPEELQIAWGSLWGLASGVTAAFAIIFLNLTRQHNDTDTVLFIVFGIGTALLALFFWKDIHVPNRLQLFYLVLCASMAVIGQYLLTMGFRYVSPVKGGIISLFRLLFAIFLGPYITSDPALKMTGWIGALLILGANVYFIVRKTSR